LVLDVAADMVINGSSKEHMLRIVKPLGQQALIIFFFHLSVSYRYRQFATGDLHTLKPAVKNSLPH
jgi:hypothetical protein